ncbi:MAG: ATP synthase subunit C [Candidatus Marinimicrobia bacterium]|nr:ATP synthase subunit C [Candidatus Neomarinimicrobiota bacterium]MCK9484067.1 ATP synthase subunit C [Candidatus Neomarinimicrobiota bacterium]MCK9559222.1 ATP synthase subunit C [Candidatus Neomarinimicrobiota bacterium]MDD5062234.1 ATP synthase subunit C [Candidatus Neomarinimicrobiota bacterium]MDD5541270.1 ATP synthase subunit C [Candidatus Neomarinimicrobiota bacterium]
MLKSKTFKKLLAIVITLGLVTIGGTSLLVLKAIAQTPQNAEVAIDEKVEPAGTTAADNATRVKFGFIAAALAVGIGSVGAAIAVGNIGTAAMGTIGEKPELSGSALIFVGLAEGIAIYGLIVAIMILGKI